MLHNNKFCGSSIQKHSATNSGINTHYFRNNTALKRPHYNFRTLHLEKLYVEFYLNAKKLYDFLKLFIESSKFLMNLGLESNEARLLQISPVLLTSDDVDYHDDNDDDVDADEHDFSVKTIHEEYTINVDFGLSILIEKLLIKYRENKKRKTILYILHLSVINESLKKFHKNNLLHIRKTETSVTVTFNVRFHIVVTQIMFINARFTVEVPTNQPPTN
ncbi:hypothetical protein FF38_06508 [Lucilia cuprina]|uniref:Uncharacterized protein n=1 Tax=Lucilia cuprina TaxID=7375 RepID=A0A0L0C4Z5_LUCCU|nr:hypothetical protein FF38_06508 [Lucilia cuprina]